MTYTDTQKKLLRDLIDKWQGKLGLGHWRIYLHWDEPAADGTILEVQCIYGRQSANVFVGSFFTCSESSQENAVCHELLHVMSRPLWDHIETVLDGLSGQSHDLMRKVLRDDEERLTDSLAQALAPVTE